MNLISKYNVAAPRYTSYPTVPYWQHTPAQAEWRKLVANSFAASNSKNGISLYIHLPYCESLCTYCACNTRITVNHAVEGPYIDALLKEWDMYLRTFNARPRLKEIHLGGGTPTFFSAANLKRLLGSILNTATVCADAEFSFEAHPNNTTREHLETLYSLGFRRVSYGIQDFDSKVQTAINRIQSFETVACAVQEARRVGFTSVNFDLVYGLPFQTLQSVKTTIDKVNLLRPDRIAFYSYAHVPWLKPGQRKFTEQDLPADVEKRKLYELGLELFETNGYKTIGMDHFALANDTLFKALKENTLHRNFMGYTHNYTRLLVGLGASSIGDTWDGFAQNIKTVEGYLAAVEQNAFPIFKGHVLDQNDLVLRRHILNIMCTGASSWSKPEEQCGALYDGLERLQELIKDGLVIVEPMRLQVTEAGRPFLRNICMCLDERYWQSAPKNSIFSSAV